VGLERVPEPVVVAARDEVEHGDVRGNVAFRRRRGVPGPRALRLVALAVLAHGVLGPEHVLRRAARAAADGDVGPGELGVAQQVREAVVVRPEERAEHLRRVVAHGRPLRRRRVGVLPQGRVVEAAHGARVHVQELEDARHLRAHRRRVAPVLEAREEELVPRVGLEPAGDVGAVDAHGDAAAAVLREVLHVVRAALHRADVPLELAAAARGVVAVEAELHGARVLQGLAVEVVGGLDFRGGAAALLPPLRVVDHLRDARRREEPVVGIHALRGLREGHE